jgi:hypothetical protein
MIKINCCFLKFSSANDGWLVKRHTYSDIVIPHNTEMNISESNAIDREIMELAHLITKSEAVQKKPIPFTHFQKGVALIHTHFISLHFGLSFRFVVLLCTDLFQMV